MDPLKPKKHWLSISATIVLGAFGSGLWSLLEPFVGKIGNGILSLATLGIQSIQDATYASAALGLHELASLYILAMATIFLFITPLMVALTPLLRSKIRNHIVGKENDDEYEAGDDKLYEIRRKRALKLLLAATLFSTLSGSIFLIKFLMVNQENLIASYYRQRVTVIRPYISESDFNGFNSSFAKLKSKQEYLSLMERMKIVGKANGVEVREVLTW